MKVLARLVLIIALLIIAVFAVGNRAPVTVSFWPLPWELRLPLYLAVLGAAAAGLVAGGAACWGSRARLARRLRAAERRARDLAEREAPRAREAAAVPGVPVMPRPPAGGTPARLHAAMDD